MNLELSAKKFIFSSKVLDMQDFACIIRRFADSQIRRFADCRSLSRAYEFAKQTRADSRSRSLSRAYEFAKQTRVDSRSRSLKNLSDITNFLKKHPCRICVFHGANSHGFFYIKNLTAKNGSQRSLL